MSRFRRAWNDPVWSKVIAGALIGAAALVWGWVVGGALAAWAQLRSLWSYLAEPVPMARGAPILYLLAGILVFSTFFATRKRLRSSDGNVLKDSPRLHVVAEAPPPVAPPRKEP